MHSALFPFQALPEADRWVAFTNRDAAVRG
jgi:hypothetical protein